MCFYWVGTDVVLSFWYGHPQPHALPVHQHLSSEYFFQQVEANGSRAEECKNDLYSATYTGKTYLHQTIESLLPCFVNKHELDEQTQKHSSRRKRISAAILSHFSDYSSSVQAYSTMEQSQSVLVQFARSPFTGDQENTIA